MKNGAYSGITPFPSTVEAKDWLISLPGRELGVRIYRPKDVEKPPVMLYFHGGGFSLGSYVSHDMVTSGLCDDTKALIISVNYRRTPENLFPMAVDDGWDSLQWVLASANFLNADVSRITVAGDSCGAQITRAICVKARDQGGPVIRMQGLLYRMLDVDFDRQSYVADLDPASTRANNIFYWTLYLDGKLDTSDPLAIPMLARLEGLPFTYVLAVEFDSMRDESVAYVKRLEQAGVSYEYDEPKRTCHGLLRARFASKVANAATLKFAAAVKRQLT